MSRMMLNKMDYYRKMYEYDRLIPLFEDGRVFITVSISNDIDKFFRKDPWEFVEDNPMGNICYIEQCVSDKKMDNQFRIWSEIKKEISERYPNVETIYWVRYKDGKLHKYNHILKGERI